MLLLKQQPFCSFTTKRVEIINNFNYDNLMKICTRCKEKKIISQFNFKIKNKGIRNSECRNCSRIYIREHYKNNRKYYLEKAKKRNRIIWLRIRQLVWEYLNSHPCVDCGEKDPIVLEFDHIRDKKSNISELTKDASLNKVVEEIAKCEVRCANCHRRKTANYLGWYKYRNIMPL